MPGAFAAVEAVLEPRYEYGLAEAVFRAFVAQVGYGGDVIAIGGEVDLCAEGEPADVCASIDGPYLCTDGKLPVLVGEGLAVVRVLGHDVFEPVVPVVEAAVYAAAEEPMAGNRDECAEADLRVEVAVQATAAVVDLCADVKRLDGVAAQVEAVGLRMPGHGDERLLGGYAGGKQSLVVQGR